MKYIHWTLIIAICIITPLMPGCYCTAEPVPQGTVGRVKTADGWTDEILSPGHHNVWGRDVLYLIETVRVTQTEKMNILVGGKVNLKLEVVTRSRLNTAKEPQIKKLIEEMPGQALAADRVIIAHRTLYQNFLGPEIQEAARDVVSAQPDVVTVTANRVKINDEIRKRIFKLSETTPLTVEMCKIVNYDWPDSITKAQERLAQVKLKEEEESALVRAELKRAEGQLKVEEALKLVELKKAEAVAESIDIIKEKLAGAPEYLSWHQIRMLSEAAKGPNNAFILIPYGTPHDGVRRMADNAQLKQMLNAKK